MKREDVPIRYRAMYDLAMSGKSRRSAIRVHCVMCMGWEAQHVAGCSAPSCPLYPYRMGDVDGILQADEAAEDGQEGVLLG